MSYTLTTDTASVTLNDPMGIDFTTTRNIVNYVFPDDTDEQEDEGKTIDQITLSGMEWASAAANMEIINTMMDDQETVTMTGLSDSNLNTDYRVNAFSFNQQGGWVNRYKYSLTLERLQDRLG